MYRVQRHTLIVLTLIWIWHSVDASDGVILHTWDSSQRCSALTSTLAIPPGYSPAYLLAETPRTYLVATGKFPHQRSDEPVMVIEKESNRVIGRYTLHMN